MLEILFVRQIEKLWEQSTAFVLICRRRWMLHICSFLLCALNKGLVSMGAMGTSAPILLKVVSASPTIIVVSFFYSLSKVWALNISLGYGKRIQAHIYSNFWLGPCEIITYFYLLGKIIIKMTILNQRRNPPWCIMVIFHL